VTPDETTPATPAPASEEDALLLHLDDFLNVAHDEIQRKLGQVHVEALSAFANAKKALGRLKQTESQWRLDLDAWLQATPK